MIALPSVKTQLGNVSLSLLRTLRDVSIPDGVALIGDLWFAGSNVRTVSVAASVKEIGAKAFYNCTQLQMVLFSQDSKLEKIDDFCFMDSGIEEIVTPPSLRTICAGAFIECEQLKYVELNEGLETVELAYAIYDESDR